MERRSFKSAIRHPRLAQYFWMVDRKPAPAKSCARPLMGFSSTLGELVTVLKVSARPLKSNVVEATITGTDIFRPTPLVTNGSAERLAPMHLHLAPQSALSVEPMPRKYPLSTSLRPIISYWWSLRNHWQGYSRADAKSCCRANPHPLPLSRKRERGRG